MSMSTLAARLEYDGGNQLGRINQQKLRSLRAAFKNDYQSRMITTDLGAWPCLINNNPSGLKSDYDKKIISVEFDSRLEPGDVFYCPDDQTHWMVYLPVLTETAYLRSEIIRCRYTLDIEGTEYWIYFQGATETDLRWGQKGKLMFNELNMSGTIYIKNTPQTKSYFSRFKNIKIDDHMWEVQITDSISVPGILELEVQEWYDDKYKNLPAVYAEATSQSRIIGQTTVVQNKEYGYQIPEEFFHEDWKWSVEGNDRVFLKEILRDGRTCRIKVEDGAIRTFDVVYSGEHEAYKTTAIIDIVEPYIQGPTSIFPYDEIEYTTDGSEPGIFYVDNEDVAQIVPINATSCKVKIITGRKGKFTLFFKTDEISHIEPLVPDEDLPITDSPVESDESENDELQLALENENNTEPELPADTEIPEMPIDPETPAESGEPDQPREPESIVVIDKESVIYSLPIKIKSL